MHILFSFAFTNFILFLLTSLYIGEKIKKSKAALLLIFLYLSFSIWCFGSAFFYLSETTASAFFWYHISSIGWLLFPAFTLHFFVRLSFSAYNKKLKKKFYFIYVVPVIFFGMEVLFHETLLQKDLIESNSGLGWAMTLATDRPFYYLYVLYIGLYIGLGMVYVRKWGAGMTSLMHKEHGKKMFYMTAVVGIAGFFVDLILPLFSHYLPPFSNILLFLLLVSTIINLKAYDIFEIPGFIAYRTILNTLEDMVLLFDADYKFFSITPSVTTFLGYTLDDLKGKELTYILLNNTYNLENVTLLSEKKYLYDKEVTLVSKNGYKIPTVYSASVAENKEGEFLGYILCVRDISARKIREQALIESTKKYKELIIEQYTMANFDSLTSLPNRRKFFSDLEEKAKNYQADHKDFALLYMDLNGFKAANDTYGHAAGDEILKEAALRLKLAASDTWVARIGGDEFVMFYADYKDLENLIERKEKIRDLFTKAFLVQKQPVTIGIAIGHATFCESKEDINQLLALADQRMYHDKAAGKAMQK